MPPAALLAGLLLQPLLARDTGRADAKFPADFPRSAPTTLPLPLLLPPPPPPPTMPLIPLMLRESAAFAASGLPSRYFGVGILKILPPVVLGLSELAMNSACFVGLPPKFLSQRSKEFTKSLAIASKQKTLWVWLCEICDQT